MKRYFFALIGWCLALAGTWAQSSDAILFFEQTERILIEDRGEEAMAAVQAVKAAPEDKAWLALACVLEGSYLTNVMQTEAAHIQFDSAAAIIAQLEEAGHPATQRARWEWLYYEGLLYMNTQRYAEATQRWDTGIDEVKAAQGERSFALVKFYVGAGALYGQSGKGRKSLELFHTAHSIVSEQSPVDSFTLANVNLNLGTMYSNFGNAQKAVPYLEQAAYYLERHVGGHFSQTPMAFSALGSALTSLGEYERGSKLQEKAIQQFIATFGEEYYYLVYAYYYSHKSHALAGRYEEALIFIEKSASLALKIFGPDNLTYAQMLALQANTTMNTGRTEGVKAMLDTAQRVSHTVRAYNTDLDEVILFSYPRYYTMKGMRQEAIAAYLEAIAFLPDAPTDLQRNKAVQGWRALGNLYALEEKHHQAQAAFDRSLEEVRALENHNFDWVYFYSQTLQEAAEYHVERQQYDNALALIDTLTRLTQPFQQALSDHIIRTEALRVRALTPSDPTAAIRYFEQAVEQLQRFRTSTLQASLLTESGHRLYTAGILAYDALDRLDEVYLCFERSRAATLQLKAQARSARTNGFIPEAVLLREKALKEALARIEKAIYLGQDTAESGLSLQLLEAQSALQDFQTQLRSDYPRYQQLLQAHTAIPLPILQKRLATDELLLHYHWSPQQKQVARLSITRDDVSIDYFPITTDLQRAILDLHDLVQSPAVARADRRRILDTHRQQLAILLPDLTLHSDDLQRLTIIPDGPLFYLPFELLPLHDGRYLIERYTVTYRYTASPLHTAHSAPQPAATLYAFAPVFAEDAPVDAPTLVSSRDTTQRAIREGRFVPLHWSEQEVNALQDLFPDAQVRLHQAATQADLRQALSGGYRMVHIASHSFANLFRAQLSGIACSPQASGASSILYATDIYGLSANADLVTLSSCESGLGALKRGEAMLGINHSFLYAGVPHVVSSLWKVNDRYTAQFMAQFYSYIAQGDDYAKALQRAKVDLLSAEVPASPNIWAAFLLMSAD